MRHEFVVYSETHNNFTPDEVWSFSRDARHHYDKQATYAIENLPVIRGGKCLVIGSPLFEAQELSQRGWDVTYMDVRRPPSAGFNFIRADAATYPFEPESFDAASSTSVLCHAGLGRYTDPELDDADTLIMANICKALKSGARAAITFGPVAPMSGVLRIGKTHRIYTLEAAREMTAGFRIIEERILDAMRNEWVSVPDGSDLGRTYLSMLLGKT